MRAKLVLLPLFALMASGQDVARVFHLHHIETEQDLGQFATLVRTISDLPHLSSDAAQKTVSVSGTAKQVAIAEWLFTELDRQTVPDSVSQEFQVAADGSDVVRLFFLKNAPTVQDFQEVATAVRTIAEIRRVFTYNGPRALAMRGTADQLAAAAFMVAEIDRPAGVKRTDSRSYQMLEAGDHGESVVKVFYLPYTSTVQEFQEVATLVRTVGEIRRVFTYNLPKVVVVRGTAGQVAAAEWMIHELGQPLSASKTASAEYLMADPENKGDNVVQVFYVKDTATVAAFQQVATGIRTSTKIRRVFTYNSSRAMAVRGTAEQIAMASQILKDRQIASK